jgi:hypothetical protein
MLRGLWNRLMARERDETAAVEAEREHMSPAERHFSKESIDDYQADEVVGERLGGIEPDRLLDEDEPPRN